jgi:hypothetical protein
VYHLTAEGMHFMAWKLSVHQGWRSVSAPSSSSSWTPHRLSVGLDYEFTNPRVGRHNHHAAVLQLSVASEVLVCQICQANGMPQLLKEFLKDTTIRFCGAAIANDVHMLRSYRIEIPSV